MKSDGKTDMSSLEPPPAGAPADLGHSHVAENAEQHADDKELRELRVEYWSKRLDHTLTHTQTSSRLIYLLDGAVLALVYFTVQTFSATRPLILGASLFIFFLVGLNALHARLIRIQHSWYSGIDAKLRKLLAVDVMQHTQTFRVFGSTHGIYRSMHVAIAAFLFLIAVAMFLYGLGCFPDMPLTHAKGGGLIKG